MSHAVPDRRWLLGNASYSTMEFPQLMAGKNAPMQSMANLLVNPYHQAFSYCTPLPPSTGNQSSIQQLQLYPDASALVPIGAQSNQFPNFHEYGYTYSPGGSRQYSSRNCQTLPPHLVAQPRFDSSICNAIDITLPVKRTTTQNGAGQASQAYAKGGGGVLKKPSRAKKITQPAYCDICNVDCNSKDVLETHRNGKKHRKNLGRLQSKETAACTTGQTMVVGKDLESKKKRVIEGGANRDAIRACQICNIVCNSDVVFQFHLAGQKHATMLKRQSAMASSILI